MRSGVHTTRSSTVPPSDLKPSDGLVGVLIANRARLLRFFTSRTRDAAEAEDIVQEIYVHLCKATHVPVAEPLAYIHRVGLNIVIDRARERGHRRKREEDWAETTATRLGTETVDDRPSPFAELEARQRAQAIAAAIDALPAGAKRVFQLHKLEGLTHGEVAASLGISRSGVEKHIAVAFRHLAKVLEQ